MLPVMADWDNFVHLANIRGMVQAAAEEVLARGRVHEEGRGCYYCGESDRCRSDCVWEWLRVAVEAAKRNEFIRIGGDA